VQTLVDVSNKIKVSKTGLVHKPNTDLCVQTVTLTNGSASAITGPFFVTFNNSSSGNGQLPEGDFLTAVTFVSSTGVQTTLTVTYTNGVAGVFIPANLIGSLAPGASVKLNLTFQLDSAVAFVLAPKANQDS